MESQQSISNIKTNLYFVDIFWNTLYYVLE